MWFYDVVLYNIRHYILYSINETKVYYEFIRILWNNFFCGFRNFEKVYKFSKIFFFRTIYFFEHKYFKQCIFFSKKIFFLNYFRKKIIIFEHFFRTYNFFSNRFSISKTFHEIFWHCTFFRT